MHSIQPHGIDPIIPSFLSTPGFSFAKAQVPSTCQENFQARQLLSTCQENYVVKVDH